jgi:hypothetical protein
VKTDTSATTVSFSYSKSEKDMTEKLNELAAKNEHIKDWKKKS